MTGARETIVEAMVQGRASRTGCTETIVETVIRSETVTETIGPRGAQGAPGRDAVGGDLQMTAGMPIGGQILVAADADGNAEVLTPEIGSLQRYAGISLHAAAEGAAISVRLTGPVEEPSWTFTRGARLYPNGNGTLTEEPPVAGPIMQVAVALSATRILLFPQPIIARP